MKSILVSDSGLGGLDMAARLLTRYPQGLAINYINACPAADHGYQKLDEETRKRVFRGVLDAMEGFHPERLVLACNTLSVVLEQMGYQPPFPVSGMLGIATAAMTHYLETHPENALVVTGTPATISSGIYGARLTAAGHPNVPQIAIPDLVNAIEQDPQSSTCRALIHLFAEEARKQVGNRRFAIALCCTHFGYSRPLFEQELPGTDILNPNEHIPFLEHIDAQSPSTFAYHARFPVPPAKLDNITHLFETRCPSIVQALTSPNINPALFPYPPTA
ncbi:MAG: aspartate/glutamate racemase family protein [Victivallales bacterium]|nr:aspartate/glutamate racemase family protein [Victivallales bacterium]